MPRYFFHIRQGDTTIPDDEGIECESLDAVREEALQGARQIMSDAILGGELGENRTLVIKDTKGDIVHELPFQAAITQKD